MNSTNNPDSQDKYQFSYEAKVVDLETGLACPFVSVEISGSDGSFSSQSSDFDGRVFLLDKSSIKPNTSYQVRISYIGYMPLDDSFSTIELKKSTAFEREYSLRIAAMPDSDNKASTEELEPKEQIIIKDHSIGSDSENSEFFFDYSSSPSKVESVYLVSSISFGCDDQLSDVSGLLQLASSRLTSEYNVLERKYLDAILDEQKLGMTGLLSEQSIVEAGCLQGAEGIIFCEIGCIDGVESKQLKLVDCATGQQQWSAIGIGEKSTTFISGILENLGGQ